MFWSTYFRNENLKNAVIFSGEFHKNFQNNVKSGFSFAFIERVMFPLGVEERVAPWSSVPFPINLLLCDILQHNLQTL